MSAMAERARSRAKEKVERLTRSSTGKVDASGWKEPMGENATVQTGPRPISRRQFRRGGKVHGETAHRADRKARAKGGALTANSLINRDVKAANQEREGTKHVGGMKKGGRAHKFVGGPMMGRPGMPPAAPMMAGHGARNVQPVRPGMRPYAKGGKVGHPRDCKCCGGGAYKAGGSVADGSLEGTRPVGDRLARKSGGSAKKGTNINIIIAPSGGGAPKPVMPPPAMPPGGPVGLHQGPPPPMPPPGAAPPMGPPPMARKRGGRTSYPIEHGAGGGLGRIEKARAYG